ncbi:MAG TPA: hypothetical protein VFG63_01250 [Nocardioidaceae bacterium]|nr:hypothetical protein [Nocardioidaceae bacterium]
MRKPGTGCVLAAIALSVVPLAGCAAATDKLSSADACADLVGLSLSELRDVQEQADDPQSLAAGLRDAAQEFEDKAADVDDADVRKAAAKYASKMKRLAEAAESGQAPDVNEVVEANQDLAEACG